MEHIDSSTTLLGMVGVFVFGVAVHLSASYLKPFLDGLYGRFTARGAAAAERRTALVERLLQDPQQELLYTTRTHHHSISALALIMLLAQICVLCLVMQTVPSSWFAPFEVTRLVLALYAVAFATAGVAGLELYRLSDRNDVVRELRRRHDQSPP
jgi:hypothetical protein